MAPNPKSSETVTRLSKIEDIQIVEEDLTHDREWLFDDALSLIGNIWMFITL